MKTPIPLSVLVIPPAEGMEWIATVSAVSAGRGTGTASGLTIGNAIQDALLIALTSSPEHAEALVS